MSLEKTETKKSKLKLVLKVSLLVIGAVTTGGTIYLAISILQSPTAQQLLR